MSDIRTEVNLAPLEPDVLDALRQVSTATLATQIYKLGFNSRVMRGVRRLGNTATMVGVARTLRYVAAREDIDTLPEWQRDENPQRLIADIIEPGQVLVVEAREDQSCGTMGGMLVARMQARGAAGIVSDAPYRDGEFIAGLSMPTFATGMNANTNLIAHHPEDLDMTITCAGVQVRPGDVIVGDGDGVIVIPRYLAADVAEPSLRQEREEAWIEKRIMAGAPVSGTYPMSEATRAEFEADATDA